MRKMLASHLFFSQNQERKTGVGKKPEAKDLIQDCCGKSEIHLLSLFLSTCEFRHRISHISICISIAK